MSWAASTLLPSLCFTQELLPDMLAVAGDSIPWTLPAIVECGKLVLAQAALAAWTLGKHRGVLESVLQIILSMLPCWTRLRMSQATQCPRSCLHSCCSGPPMTR